MRCTGERRVRLAIKRLFDVVGASVGLLLAAPFMVILAITIRCILGRPILFRHVRPGLDGKPFEMIKFRTMRPPHPDEVPYLSDDARLTRLGRFLRVTSLDELPELFNVLKGDMSLVGPRPLLVEYLDYYTPEQARRHELPPGITGWAAVRGRNSLKFDDRLALDTWYVDNWSLHLDARIAAMTVVKVLLRDGASVVENDVELGFPLPGLSVEGTARERSA
jgi:lipopolysaccharide/colanic/teichoic acid biosynthesis glycosyltransferase